MDMDLKKWTREREQLRRVFNRHELTAKTIIDIEFLSIKIEKMVQLNESIQNAMLSNADYDQAIYEKECEECDTFQLKWLNLKSKVNPNHHEEDDDCKKGHKKHNLNLPKLEIRKFDDNPKIWLSFWGQFKKIHENKSMDAETKFQYLTQAMTANSKARGLVESYPPTEDNYTKVIQTLKDRFAKDETLIEIYVRELLKLVNCKNQVSLDILYDQFVANLQILESLGIIRDKYECILLPMIESALPESTLLLWSKVPHIEGESKLGNLLKFLQTEVEAERRVQLAKTNFLDDTSTKEMVPTAACLMTEAKQVSKSTGGQHLKEGKENCYFCDKPHNTLECGKASTLNLEEKKDAIKKKGGCYVCLKRGHLAKNCKGFVRCMCCNRRHLIVLCPTLHNQPKTCEQNTDKQGVASNFSSNNNTTMLQTLIVKISGSNKEKKVRALLDSGSQRTYVKASVAQDLGLEVVRSESLSHSLFGGIKKESQAHRVYKFQVSSLDNSYFTTMTGLEQNVLCGNLPKVQDIDLITKLEKHQIHLTDADKDATITKDIDLLIGSDYLGCILDNNIVHITDKLVAIKTKLGWTLHGPIKSSGSYNIVCTNLVTAIPGMDNSLEFLWNIETLGIKDPYIQEKDDMCVDIIVNDRQRYEVPLQWKDGYPRIEPNYETAKRRLFSTTKKLSNTGRLEDYHNIFQEWEKEGVIELVETDNNYNGHYLPHHAVIKLESTTTKIRPVFDASSKDKKGLSLNMCIKKGANLIELIPKLIIMFRAGMYGVIADIKKAFLQISISPEDRKYLKLLWWNNPDTRDKILTYQHARVPFGIICSPFLLATTINYHLEQNTETYPRTAVRLRESFYVDNCVTSFDTKAEVEQFIKESTELMNKGKFELREWMTNSLQKEEPVSVLGVQWDRHTDNLNCKLNLKTLPSVITKRNLLSVTQQIFDPIGFLCPVSLVPKLITQKIWLLNTGWDEVIPTELEEEYKDWVSNIDCLQECKIPRRLSRFPLHKCKTTVHVFCDACKDAFAGCIFLRTEHEGQITVRLILARSRVAPIKRKMTLPRLELMGALIASRLYHEILTSGLLSVCKNYKVYCWTDSAVVLAWIQRQDTWKAFVTNRVKKICMNTNQVDRNHLPGSCNPADLPSRGCNSKSLLETHWWTGPQWLYLKEEEWPKSIVNYTKKEDEIISSEQIKNTSVNLDITSENFSSNLLYFNQYNKIVRLVARLLRWSPRIRNTYNISSKIIGYEEYKHAEETLIKIIQKDTFAVNNEIKMKLMTTEENNIIKVKTRLEYSGQDKDFIHPILLPGNHEIVHRMVQEKHRQMKHAGTQTLMATLRNTFWITGIRKLVKRVVSKCIICKRYKTKHYIVPEPPLPADRIKTAAPFEVTGIDLAGPLFLKNSQKCWIVLFTCAVYRAIHLELTESLSTNSFLMALRRFIARRGKARIIYTDNGTNFVGAANLLRDINWPEVEESTNSYKILWKFSVPSAPWWGGWWERLVRVVKDMLRRILGKASVDWIELSTILCDCELVINSRPLTYVEMGDVKPLTPLLFLQSLPTSETPDLDQIDEKNIHIRYRYLQQLRQDFRKRFKSEYLSLLISKGKEISKEPKIGDLVLIETDSSRLHWPLGLIIDIYVGKDGFTRVARLQTASGVKVRPYQRLYPLELSTVPQDWLDNIPASSVAVPQQQIGSQNSIAPVPLASTTRSGRTIKIPFRFME